MKPYGSFLALLALLLLLPATISAQNRLLIGPALGYEFSVPLFLQRAPGAINNEPTFEGRGTSASHTIQLGVAALVPDVLGAGSIGGRLLLGVTSGWFESEQFVPGDTGAMQILGDPRRFEVEGLAGSLQLDASFRMHLGGRLSAGLGLWSLYRFAARYTRSEYLVSPILSEFSQPTVTIRSDIGGYPLAAGPGASVAATLDLTPGTTLQAEVWTRVDLVGLRRGLGAGALTLSPAVSLLIGPTKGATIIIPAEPLAGGSGAAAATSVTDASTSIGASSVASPSAREIGRDTIARPAAPTARIDMFGVSGDGPTQSVAISATDAVRRVYAVPARLVPFAPGEAVPLAGVARLAASETPNFQPTSLTGQDAGTHARHALNMLAMRLRSSPGASVRLVGGRTPKERDGLGLERAEWVRRYLVDAWGIEASRVLIADRALPVAGVVIDGPPELFAPPFVSQWRQRSGMLPEISIERDVNAPAGLRRWELDVSHGGTRLAHASSDDEAVALNLRFVGERRPDDALLARLTVEDSLGRRTVAEDRLPLVRSEAPGAPVLRREIVEVLLPVSSDGSLDSGASTLIAIIGSSLRNGARVAVAPIGRSPAAGATSALLIDVGRRVLGAAAARGAEISRFEIERTNADPTVAPVILVSIQSDAD